MDYQFAPNNLTLSESALKHILHGDLSKRTERIDGKTKLTTILSGGLHTIKGWEQFLSERPDIKHGLFFDDNAGEDWYFIREASNGVMLLKMPRSAFKNNAAKLTKMAENYYNSGYLWKTLFPIEFDEAAIVKAIEEALINQDAEETTNDHIIGYTKSDDPFKVLKIRIQIRGTEILSAFPTWGQPMTGNEGKPYSPTEGLRLIVAASTRFPELDLIRYNNLLASFNKAKLQDLLAKTPHFILSRPRVTMGKERVRQRYIREKELGKIAARLTIEESAQVYQLAMSDIYLRYPFAFLRSMYDEYYLDSARSLKTKNAVMLYQNLQELLTIMFHKDKADNTHRAFEVIKRYLKVHFIFTGGIDQWEVKRLSSVMIDIVVGYNEPVLAREFFELLNISPIRFALFIDFNTYTLLMPRLELYGLTGIEEPLYLNHFYEYVVQQLGVNYSLNFTPAFNRQKAIEAQEDVARYGIDLAKDQVMYSLAKDFRFFSEEFPALCSAIEINADGVKLIEEILMTYKKCTAVNIQRILITHREIMSKPEETYEFGTPDYERFTHAKHEYRFISQLFQLMLEKLETIFREAGFQQEAELLEEKFGYLMGEVEKLPIPKSVPQGLVGSATPADFEDHDPPKSSETRPYKIKKNSLYSPPFIEKKDDIEIFSSLPPLKF